MFAAEVNALMDFNDRLLSAKWLDAHSTRYEGGDGLFARRGRIELWMVFLV